MEDESTSIDQQTPESETGSERSTDDNTVEATSQDSEVQTNTVEAENGIPPVPYPKFKETRQENKRLKEELAKYKGESTPTPASTPQGDVDDEASQAIDLIAQRIEQKLSPRLQVLEKQEKEDAIRDIGNRPYAGELATEIAKAMKDMSPDIPFQQRLDSAYKDALAANIGSITSKKQEEGYKDAYSKIAEKKSAQASKPVSSKGTNVPKFDLRNMTEDEKRAQWAEILESNLPQE